MAGLRNKLNREKKDSATAEQDEENALQLEAQEEREEAAVASEVRNFSSSLRQESALVKDVAAMTSSKYTLVRVFSTASTARRNLGTAKKKLFGNLLGGARRLRTLTKRARVGMSGVSAISPAFGKDMELWLAEQRKELELLASEVVLQIKEDEEEAAAVSPVLEKNREIRGKLDEHSKLLGRENQLLGGIKGNLMQKISAERRELQLSRDALQKELDELRTQRSVS